MFDKNWFYFLKEVWFQKYTLDLWASVNLILKNNEYVVFHKRRFFKKNTNELQKGMALLTKVVDINFEFDSDFFVYWLTYYQRDWKNAFIKWWDLDELELYQDLYSQFWLQLKLRKYLEIHWGYPTIDNISNNIESASINQVISFLLALATIYWDWNLIEENDNVYLSNILIRFPFDSSLWEFKDIIFTIEDLLLKNWIYNKLTITRKQDFIWNIYDFDLLRILWKAILDNKIKDFYQVDEEVLPLYSKKMKELSFQLDTDLRIDLNEFKLTEIESVKIDF